jgi:hypothetical protein
MSYFINSFGEAIQVRPHASESKQKFMGEKKNIQVIGYVASLKVNSETKMGVIQAAYGACFFFKLINQ